jgi:radical SAM superfamily enzyme YgiQ (UPF0313 family)
MPISKDKPDIILVRPKDSTMPLLKKTGALQHPMNLVYLASWLKFRGYNSEIIDLEIVSASYLEERLKSVKPYLVGITVMTPNITEAQRICRLCRAQGINTVLGGTHPSALPIETLRYTGCDYVIIGEGEKPLCALLRKIKDNQPLDNVAGLAFMKDNVPTINRLQELINLDDLPLPERRFLNLGLYKGESTPGILGKAAVIFTSRGCPYACTFCASGVVNQGKVRFRNMEKIFEEIDDIIKLGFKHLTVEDDIFTLEPDRVKKFCKYLITRYPRVSWDCDARADTLNEELLQLMKASNCRKIALGVESGSANILKSLKKNIKLEQVRETFRIIKKHKILSQAFFMVGYPGEKKEDIEATESLINQIQPDLLFLSVCVPYPGTPIYDYMLNKNFLSGCDWDSFAFFREEVPWHTEYFTGKELVAMRKRISRRFYFRLSYIIRRLILIRDFREIVYLIKGLAVAFGAFCCSIKNKNY